MALIKVTSAQITYTWMGGSTGDYQLSANWSPLRSAPATNDILSFNAASPVNVVNVPNQTIGAVAIASGTSIVSFATNTVGNMLTLSAAAPLVYTTPGIIQAADFMTIALSNPGTFTFTTGTLGIAVGTGGKIIFNGVLTINGGTIDVDVLGTGGTTINGTVTFITGNFTCNTANVITWANGANYNHAANGTAASAIPRSIWSVGSSCNITGLNGGAIVPTGMGTAVNTFANFSWNCAAQGSAIDLISSSDSIVINGTCSVISTGTQSLRLAGASGGLIKMGAYSQTGGTVVLQSSSGVTNLRVSGSFAHSGGIIDAVEGAGSGAGILDLKGSVTKGAATQWRSSSASAASLMTVQFSGFTTQAVDIAGTWTAPAAGRCNINVSNNDLVSGVSLTGILQVYNTSSTSAASCFVNGIITGSGNVVYSGAGSGGLTLSYGWVYPQNASAIEFPNVNGPTNLTINNLLGVSFPASGFSRTLTGTLNLLSGNLDLGSNTLSLTNTSLAGQLNYTAGFITKGTLRRSFPTTGLPTTGATASSRFPFGSGANDRSLNVFFSGANLTGGSPGTISVTHTPAISATAISITDDIPLDKRSNSNWTISAGGGFNLGSGGQTISITALGTNIGSVDNISSLRLTNGVGAYGTLIATSGTNDAPLVGKSGLLVSDITAKTVYFGSNNLNALQIITFTWTGAVNSDWATAGNWTGGVGYPSASTEIADITTPGSNMPSVNTATSINLYQLKVGAPVTLTLAGSASVNVVDTVAFNGTASFASTSTFTFSGGAGTVQNIPSLVYGNLVFTGNGSKILPATITVTGSYTLTGTAPVITGNTFVFAGTGTQKIGAGFFNNITISGNRGGAQIGLGNLVSTNTIDIAGDLIITATNYTVKNNFNVVNFSSTSTKTIPGFTYSTLSNNTATGYGDRIFDPLGAADPTRVINVEAFYSPSSDQNFTATGSKVKFNRTASTNFFGDKTVMNDLEIAGNFNGGTLQFSGTTKVAGVFTMSATNFVQVPNNTATIYFMGTGDQTIPATTALFKYDNVRVNGGDRNVTLQSSGTIGITGSLSVENPAPFLTGKGFILTGSTVNFINGSSTIPDLKPFSGLDNYNNLTLTGGTCILKTNTRVAGNVTVNGTDASPGTLKVGKGNGGTRSFTILGNLIVSGTSSVAASTAQLDMNTGTGGTTNIDLYGNLSVSGTGQITNTGDKNGTIRFYGTNQQYSNTSSFKNGFINYTVGDGLIADTTTLTLNSSLDLIRSSSANLIGTLTVNNYSILNSGINNIVPGDGTAGNAAFNLNTRATFITANTGGMEGTATSASTGTINSNASLLVKTYNSTANYVFNGASTTPFPTSASSMSMANLTLGANVSLNRAVVASGIVDLGANTLTQSAKNLQFSGLTGTGSIAADKSSTIRINGSVGTIGTLKFAPGFNITGQLQIDRPSPIIVSLGSDLLIDKTPNTGNLTTNVVAAPYPVLNINGYTLTVNGRIADSVTLNGSAASSLVLGGAGNRLNFNSAKNILKYLTLNSNATAVMSNALNIAAGTSPASEGVVTVNAASATAFLNTAGLLTLKSDASGTARVAQGRTGGGYIIGDVTIERYLGSGAKRGWRQLAAPSYGQTIKQAWQENQPAGVNGGQSGYGTMLTSTAASWAADGFDFKSNGAAFLTFNSAANTWQSVTSTSLPINSAGSNKAYFIFVRGDRSATPANGLSTYTTLRTKGTLFQGDLPAVSVAAGTYAAIGNNYAAPIDFTKIKDANIDQSFYIWDPKIAGQNGLGGYITFSAATTPAYKPVPDVPGGSYLSGQSNTLIQSGQAFLVHATAGTGNITLKENSKATGSSMVFRPVGASAISSSLTTNLLSVAAAATSVADGNVVVFNEKYSNEIDGWDAMKPLNLSENLGIARADKVFAVDARQPVNDNDTVFYNLKRLKTQQAYRFEFIPTDFDETVQAFLEDKFLKTSKPLNNSGRTYADFTITSDVLSAAPDRFRLVFKASGPLPVTFTDVKAAQLAKDIAVEWKVENEINVRSYEVEKSTDGRTFNKMNTTAGNGGNAAYNWLDKSPAAGDNFYRIRSIDNDGTAAYSKIVKINISKAGNNNFKIYPNPVMDGMIGLQMKDAGAGRYSIRLINNLGQVVDKNIMNHSGGSATQSFRLPKEPGDGMYQLEITAPDNKVTVLSMLVLGK